MLDQLREMNNKRIDLLYSPNDLNIFMTDGGENDSIEGFLEGFDYRIKKAYVQGCVKKFVKVY